MDAAAGLVGLVLQKTREGKLKWSQLSKYSYFAELGQEGVVIEIRERQQLASGPSYSLRFINKDREEIDRVSSVEASQLEEIYQQARRHALRADETIANIKRTLESL
jgi:hypothetical protein